MTVEAKIKELLEASQGKSKLNESSTGDTSQPRQGSSKDASYEDLGNLDNKAPSVNTSKDSSKSAKASTSGNGSTNPKQGDSKDATYDDLDDMESGKKASAKMSKDSTMSPKIKGDATNDMQGSSKKATYSEDDEHEDEEELEFEEFDEDEIDEEALDELSKKTLGSYINKATFDNGMASFKQGKASAGGAKNNRKEADKQAARSLKREKGIDTAVKKLTKEEITAIFGSELTEENQTKVTEIFEAAVIARVNDEMISIEEQLVEAYETELNEAIEEHKDALVEKVDSYLDYIVDQWVEENKIALENNLKLEVMEDFMEGLKTLFQENYIEIPEEKFDVVEEMQSKIDELEDRLDEEINNAIEFNYQLMEERRLNVVEDVTKGLADTEIDRFEKLIKGIEFVNEETYAEKLKVIRQNHFNKKLEESQVLQDSGETINQPTDRISRYAQAISRTVKK